MMTRRVCRSLHAHAASASARKGGETVIYLSQMLGKPVVDFDLNAMCIAHHRSPPP